MLSVVRSALSNDDVFKKISLRLLNELLKLCIRIKARYLSDLHRIDLFFYKRVKHLSRRVKSTDSLEVQVERADDFTGDADVLAKKINARIKSVVGISAKVTICEPKTLPRSEGKAKRVIDKRVM